MSGIHPGGHGRVPSPNGALRHPRDADIAVEVALEAVGKDSLCPCPGGAEADEEGMEPILEAEGVTFVYPDGTVALRDLTLAIPRGRRVCVLGANGCGKSTLFLNFVGILRPTTGQIRLAGQPVRYDRQGLTDLRRRVGLVFQDPDAQLFASSVRQDISFGPINLGLSDAEVRARVEEAIHATQIEELADRPTHLLSYGQKKRVAIAGVLAMDPDVIIADEPTAGLDPAMTARLVALLNRLQAMGRTIVISTHDVELALAWADYVFVLRQGQVAGRGRPEVTFCDRELLAQARLVQPIVLQAFVDLCARGVLPPDCPPPRDAATLAALIASHAAIEHPVPGERA